jgi:hypothetical protein
VPICACFLINAFGGFPVTDEKQKRSKRGSGRTFSELGLPEDLFGQLITRLGVSTAVADIKRQDQEEQYARFDTNATKFAILDIRNPFFSPAIN